MNLYGRDINSDYREVNIFSKNITLAYDDYLENIKRPTLLSDITNDIRNPNLFYSGIYEDGGFLST